MKLVKSLLLGSAAGLVAVASAQAADLPVKAKAVEYVKVCSLYGAGFYYMPGTDTCLKVGGYVRAQYETGAWAGGATAIGGQAELTRTAWFPHPDLELGLDVLYTKINTANAGPIPPLGINLADDDIVSAMFRVQRNFLP